MASPNNACPQATCRPLRGGLATLLKREWLLTNGRGGFAMGTVVGCATRRYHGCLVASRRPPLERFMMLSTTLDRVAIDDELIDVCTMEFKNVFSPAAYVWLKGFDYSLARPQPWVQWTYAHPRFEMRKRLTLFDGHDVAALRYDLHAPGARRATLDISPMIALRDFHGLRRQEPLEPWDVHADGSVLWIQDHAQRDVTLTLFPRQGPGLSSMTYRPVMEWWLNFRYREELERGEDGYEDLLCAGAFRAEGGRTLSAELMGVAFADSPAQAGLASERARKSHVAAPASARAVGLVRKQLLDAADQFVVTRKSARAGSEVTLMAGYPWFGDWGRDSFIALEGLLLLPGRFAEARQVLSTFASAQRNGLIPNRFDDYGGECEYNSVDASLWFVHAADRYSERSGDVEVWKDFLAPACRALVEHFLKGTDYRIRVDERGMVSCGNAGTQITWMDALCEGVAFTPRHGRPVEVNALWYHALRIIERRLAGIDDRLSAPCGELADRVRGQYAAVFWHEDGGYLFDCVREGEDDASLRPNQIFAVSLGDGLLSERMERGVLDAVTRHLLTPFGLRSLARHEPGYQPRMTGSRFERDRAYHNGTVWSWLIGPYADAWLRVHGSGDESVEHVRKVIAPLIAHLSETGLGSISEVFDGDPPHAPRGCLAQAWSVAELLRIKEQVTQSRPHPGPHASVRHSASTAAARNAF